MKSSLDGLRHGFALEIVIAFSFSVVEFKVSVVSFASPSLNSLTNSGFFVGASVPLSFEGTFSADAEPSWTKEESAPRFKESCFLKHSLSWSSS